MKSIGLKFSAYLAAMALACAGAQAAPRAATPTTPSAPGPIPVPRTTFIATMDAEFSKMDADKNGILTKKEIQDFQRAMAATLADSRRRALFAALDKDHNGVLTPTEFAQLQMPSSAVRADPLLAQTDLNHDGQITLVEFRTGKLRNFDSMDTDKDGVVSPAEMKAAGVIK